MLSVYVSTGVDSSRMGDPWDFQPQNLVTHTNVFRPPVPTVPPPYEQKIKQLMAIVAELKLEKKIYLKKYVCFVRALGNFGEY